MTDEEMRECLRILMATWDEHRETNADGDEHLLCVDTTIEGLIQSVEGTEGVLNRQVTAAA